MPATVARRQDRHDSARLPHACRKGPSRRRFIDPTTCDRDYGADEVEFMQALERYKRASGRMFPTCSEILEVVRDLGYRREASN
jgi:hypothetical protein